MNAEAVATIITGLGIGGVIQGLMVYWRDRKKLPAEVAAGDITVLTGKLKYLETMLTILNENNDKLRQNLIAAEDREYNRSVRIHSLEDELLRLQRELVQTKSQCINLEARIAEIQDRRVSE